MKKYILAIVSLISASGVVAQPYIQASIGQGSAPNRVKIFMKPQTTLAAATFSTLQFNIAVNTSITPAPTLFVVNSSIPVGPEDWDINGVASPTPASPFSEAGYNHYNIFNTAGGFDIDLINDVEFEVMELEFAGGPAVYTDLELVTLIDAGANGQTLFYATGEVESDGSSLYYARPGIVVSNQFSYDEEGINPGTGISTASFASTLPVNWLGFTAEKQNADALLKWTVSNERNNHHFELERSLNGSSFTKLADIAATPGNGVKDYSYLDNNIARHNRNVLYYRVKQVDEDGQFTYSTVRSVRLDINGQIAVHPNPVKKGFYLSIPFSNPGEKKISLNLLNSTGQVVDRRQITASQAANYYYDIQIPGVISGNYMLRIFSDTELLDTKKLVIER